MSFLLTARVWLSAGLAGALLWGTGGCASDREGSGHSGEEPLSPANHELARGTLSAVEIRGQPLETVRDTVDAVFVAAGFQRGKGTPNELVFDRPASRGQRAAYGNWTGNEVLVRLRVEIQLQGRDHYFLRCRSFIVREGGTYAEDQQPLTRSRVRKYGSLLPEVANRLN